MTNAETVGEVIGADRLSMTIRTGDWCRDYAIPASGMRRRAGNLGKLQTPQPHRPILLPVRRI